MQSNQNQPISRFFRVKQSACGPYRTAWTYGLSDPRQVWNRVNRPGVQVPRSPLADVFAAEIDSAVEISSGEVSQDDSPLQQRRRVEAVLLFHRGPIALRKLAQLAGLADATAARTLLRELNDAYDQLGSAFRVEEVAGGYQLLTRPGLAPWLRRFASTPVSIRLSPPAMETLAIVAYRQPVLRANIEAIRGVACGEILRQLMQRDLVRICGRSEELGRPYLYGTTKHFLQTFGLKDAQSLPTMSGAGVEDDPKDTCAIPADQDQATQPASPIETISISDNPRSAVSSFDAVTLKGV